MYILYYIHSQSVSWRRLWRSQITTETLDLVEHEVNVFVGGGRIGDDGAKEVRLVVEWLIADHQRALEHHSLLDSWRHLPKENTICKSFR